MKQTFILFFLFWLFAINLSANNNENAKEDDAITAQIDSLQKIADNYYYEKDY